MMGGSNGPYTHGPLWHGVIKKRALDHGLLATMCMLGIPKP